MKDLGGQVAASLATEKSTKITSWQCLPHTPEFRYRTQPMIRSKSQQFQLVGLNCRMPNSTLQE
jgi:hypothetical protein